MSLRGRECSFANFPKLEIPERTAPHAYRQPEAQTSWRIAQCLGAMKLDRPQRDPRSRASPTPPAKAQRAACFVACRLRKALIRRCAREPANGASRKNATLRGDSAGPAARPEAGCVSVGLRRIAMGIGEGQVAQHPQLFAKIRATRAHQLSARARQRARPD